MFLNSFPHLLGLGHLFISFFEFIFGGVFNLG